MAGKHSTTTIPGVAGTLIPIEAKDLITFLGPSLTPARDFVLVCKTPLDPLGSLQALPQASVGIRLSRIRKFWRALQGPTPTVTNPGGNLPDKAEDDMTTQDRALLLRHGAAIQFGTSEANSSSTLRLTSQHYSQLIDKHWKDIERDTTHKPSAKLRGFITLIATYLSAGSSPNVGLYLPTKVVKNLMFIMARTSFAALFDQLPPDEQAYYRADPNHWVNFICKKVMKRITNGKEFNPDDRLIEYKINDYGELKGDDQILLPITRKAWLTGMLNHVDLLSASAHAIDQGDAAVDKLYKDVAGLGHRLRGLAGLGNRMDTIMYKGKAEQAAIFELRSVTAKKIYFREWDTYAVRVFRFIRAINVGGRHDDVIY